MGVVVSVNVGAVVDLPTRQPISTAIVKAPVAGPVAVRGVNLDGDDQADRRAHGGPDKAVYAYARSSYAWWERQLGRELPPGIFGENLTVDGLDVDGALIGERWAIGSTVLEVAQPRIPCFKLAARMGDPQFVKRFAAARRPGAYLRIITEGTLRSGDDITVADRPRHTVTIALVNEAILFDHELAGTLLAAPALPVAVREWAASRA